MEDDEGFSLDHGNELDLWLEAFLGDRFLKREAMKCVPPSRDLARSPRMAGYGLG